MTRCVFACDCLCVKCVAVRPKRPSSWTSTPELDDSQNTNVVDKNGADVEIHIPLPRRRHTTDIPQVEESYTLRRPPLPPNTATKDAPEDFTILRTDTLAERVRKMQMLKKQNSLDRELRSRNSSSIEKWIYKFCMHPHHTHSRFRLTLN